MPKGATKRFSSDPKGESLADDRQAGRKEKLANARIRQRAIGRELRRLYDDVAQEPVPDEFLELLRKMDEGENNPEG
jgi:hypothetical protein